MSKYIRSSVESFEFDGDTIKVTLKPIAFTDVLKFNAIDVKSPTADAEGAKLMAEMLPKYVEKIEGLKDAGGNEITIGEVCSASYFAGLVAEIGARLIALGSPPNPKKPAAPSAS